MGNFTTPERMAEIIDEIYEIKFGGKERGRFQLSRSQFRRLGKRKVLREAFVDQVIEECLELGYILIPVGDIIAIIEESVIINYRKVPKSIGKTYLIEDEDENE